MKRLSIAVSLAAFIAGCGGRSSSFIPTSPSAPPPAPPPTYTLSGVAVAQTPSGLAPVEGVRVETGNMAVYAGGLPLFAMTDKNGFYRISGLSAGSSSVRAIKYGYETDVRNVTIGGDTGLDIQLVSRPTYTLSGVVSEVTPTGWAPVDDVEVYCDSCGEFGHTWAHTDTIGFYSFSGVYAGSTPLLVRKTGYGVIDPVRTFPDGTGERDATVNGDTQFDIQVVRR